MTWNVVNFSSSELYKSVCCKVFSSVTSFSVTSVLFIPHKYLQFNIFHCMYFINTLAQYFKSFNFTLHNKIINLLLYY